MNFMFEDFSTMENFVGSDTYVNSCQSRFQICPMINTMLRKQQASDIITHTNSNYLIPVGVNGSIQQWAKGIAAHREGSRFPKRSAADSLFNYLSDKYLEDMREGRAILLLDFSLEGYHEDWLFEWFHDQFKIFNIPAASVVYTVGNTLIAEQYEEYSKSLPEKMKCIPYTGFEEFIYTVSTKQEQITVDKHLEYKKNNETWAFNCPQKRARPHRKQFFKLLKQYNLVNRNLCSFPDEGHFILGDEHEKETGFYINRIHPDYCLKTFVTVVSEPQFYEAELSVFNSEKVFKPIACSHPFIVLGGKGSLQKMRDRGYKTFSDYFDESYDELPDIMRMEAIIDVLYEIESIKDKVEWFESMRPILEHNKKQLEINSTKTDVAVVELEKYYKEYFGE